MGEQKDQSKWHAELYEQALKLATEAHKGQTRWGGEPYITHPIAVASQLTGLAKVVGVLHDVIEDTPVSARDLRNAWMPKEVIAAVEAMTHHANSSYAAYLQRLQKNSLAARVKTEDLLHNISDLDPKQHRHRFEKYLLALKTLNPHSLASLPFNELVEGLPVFSLNTGKRGVVSKITHLTTKMHHLAGTKPPGEAPDIWIDWADATESLVWHDQADIVMLIEK